MRERDHVFEKEELSMRLSDKLKLKKMELSHNRAIQSIKQDRDSAGIRAEMLLRVRHLPCHLPRHLPRHPPYRLPLSGGRIHTWRCPWRRAYPLP